MNRKFNIALDIDGVLRDVVSMAVERYNKVFEKNLTVDDVTEYNFKNSFTAVSDPVSWIFGSQSLYTLSRSKAFKNVVEAIKLMKPWANITILSKQPNMDAQVRTIYWLWKKKIAAEVDEICLHRDHKCEHTDCYDIVIDDYPENFRGMKDGLAVLIEAPYNRNFDPSSEPGQFPENFLRFKSLYDFAKDFSNFIGTAVETADEFLHL